MKVDQRRKIQEREETKMEINSKKNETPSELSKKKFL